MHELITVWRRATVGEACWVDAGDRTAAIPVTPLVIDNTPCLALPYDRAHVASAMAGASEVAFTVTDTRAVAGLTGESGVAAVGTVTVSGDLDGAVFTEHLLAQELSKYPPSRTLVDSPLLRRENWWWLPRVIVRLDRLSEVRTMPVRTDPTSDALLVRNTTGLRVDPVHVSSWPENRMSLASLAGVELRGDGAPALLLGHDYSVPDLERWESWTVRGRLLGDELEVHERDGAPPRELPPLRLLDRMRRHHRLSRGCQREIAAAERARRPGAG